MAPPQFSQMDSFRSLDSTGSTFDAATELQKQFASKASQLSNKRKYKKPSGKPKRPLSAYNLFFKDERARLIDAKQKVGFSNMAKHISSLWNALDEEGRKSYVAAADIEQKKYRAAVKDWKQQSKIEMSMAFSNTTSPLIPMLSQTDPMVLQRLMIEQQMAEQQQMMMQQMENALNFSGRRMSMPSVTTSSQMTMQQNHQLQQQQQQIIMNMGRRFSMPIQMPMQHIDAVPSHMLSNQSVDLSNDTYDSTDESTLDDETADFLINMPILEDNAADCKGFPTSVVMPIPTCRRSSMPNMTNSSNGNTMMEWDVNPTPLPPSRRLSMPDLPDEMTEMQDIFAMLDDDEPNFASSRPSAA